MLHKSITTFEIPLKHFKRIWLICQINLKVEKKKEKASGNQNRAKLEEVTSFNEQQKLKYLPLKQCFPWEAKFWLLKWQLLGKNFKNNNK